MAFAIHNVSRQVVKDMNDLGYRNLSADDLVARRIHGVDVGFVKESREHGYKHPSIDDLIELRIQGLGHRESL
ncbi:MAG: hypothetical protein ACYDCG_15890 [Candidatus Acidiferrales bacterium]